MQYWRRVERWWVTLSVTPAPLREPQSDATDAGKWDSMWANFAETLPVVAIAAGAM